jgi:hypothetical protein
LAVDAVHSNKFRTCAEFDSNPESHTMTKQATNNRRTARGAVATATTRRRDKPPPPPIPDAATRLEAVKQAHQRRTKRKDQPQ